MDNSLYSFKVNNGISKDILFTDKIQTVDAPWSWLLAFERLIEDKNYQVVLVGAIGETRRAMWCNQNIDDLPKEILDHIDEHLKLLGNHETTAGDFAYPTKNDGFFFMKNGKPTPAYQELAKYCKKELIIRADDTYLSIYKDGFFQNMSRTELANLIETLTLGGASSSQHDAFKKKAFNTCYFKKDNFVPPEGYINLANGVLKVDGRELSKHSPKFNFEYKLEHNYETDARAPRFLEFLNHIFDGDQDLIKLVGEIMGYTIIGGDPVAQVAFIFYGEGANGKSTLLDVITELLGKHSVSSVSMDRIKEPFSVVRMDGKLANIVEETPTKVDAEAFKAIVGGGTVGAARKHMDEYELKVKARLFFACNDYPYFKDNSEGLRRRLVILPFNKYIPPEERNTNIKNELFAEMPGILNFALKGYERFISQGKKFTKVQAVEDTVADYMQETDSVTSWAERKVKYTGQITNKVYNKTLYDSYKDYCRENGYSACANNTFGKKFMRYLKNKIPKNVNAEDLKGRSNSDRYYLMIQLEGASDFVF